MIIYPSEFLGTHSGRFTYLLRKIQILLLTLFSFHPLRPEQESNHLIFRIFLVAAAF